jgi:hypothetical protein
MDLTPYVAKVRAELATAAEAGGEEARALAERLTGPLESAIRLTLLEALSAAADEITRDLAPGSVDLRLRGLDPTFVVTVRAGSHPGDEQPEMITPSVPDETAYGTGATARINLRLPDDLKARVEDAATRERMSVNTWLVRAAAAALGTERVTAKRGPDSGQRVTGWVR